MFRHFWNDFRTTKSSFQSLQQWWDLPKVQIKQLCQEYTFNVTRDEKIGENLAEQTGNQTYSDNFKAKKKLLADLLGFKAQGAGVRSHFQNVELMDAASKFFFHLDKRMVTKGLFMHYTFADAQAVDESFLDNLPQVVKEANGQRG